MEFLLCVTVVFSLTALKFSPITTFCHYNYFVSWCGPPWFDFTGGSLYLLDLDFCIFVKVLIEVLHSFSNPVGLFMTITLNSLSSIFLSLIHLGLLL